MIFITFSPPFSQQDKKSVESLPPDYWQEEEELDEENRFDYRDRWNKLHNLQVFFCKEQYPRPNLLTLFFIEVYLQRLFGLHVT